MNRILLLLSVTVMVLTFSCGQPEAADLVILNGKILTIDSSNPLCEAVAVKEGKISATGKTNKIRKFINPGETRVIDASGRLVIPGFNDAHLHFGPLDPDYIELRYTPDPAVITE
ncbi:MAG TPA: hypothetical protein PLO24_01245, partial [Bacteroidales bacterium]|nr:hypothetical protein [Bacteroidales bacterium]